MSDFTREAELSLTVNDAQIRRVRSQIEAGLEDIAVGVDASGVGGRGGQPRDPSTGQFMSIEGVEQRIVDQTAVVEDIRAYSEQLVDSVEARGDAGNGREDRRRRREFRWARERTEHLDDLVDLVDGMDGGGGGGGGGGLPGGIGGTVGVSAMLAGGGIGAGAGLAGAGFGLGALNLGTELGGAFSEVGDAVADAIGDGEGLVQIGDIGSPQITNDVGDITTVVEPQVGDIGSPVFRPEFGDFNPELTVNPEVTAAFEASVNFSPQIRVNPTFNLELTGLDLDSRDGGLTRQIEKAIEDVERDLKGEVSTLERRIRNATGGGSGGGAYGGGR